MSETRSRLGSRATALTVCLIVAFALRALALIQFQDVDGANGDEGYYLIRAQSIAAGDGHPGAFRPPGYPAFLAGVITVFGDSLDAARWVQVFVSLLTVAGVFQLAAVRFGTRAALFSGLVCAVTPALVHYPHFLWSECVTATALVTLFWILDRYDRTDSILVLVAAGLWLGLAAMVRETWLVFAPFVAAWILFRTPWRRSLPRVVLFALCTSVVVLPWTSRNWNKYGDLVLISTCRWYPIAVGNLGLEVEDERVETGEHIKKRDVFKGLKHETRGMNELERERYWREIALDTIGEQVPAWFWRKPVRGLTQLFSLRSQAIRFLTREWLPEPSRASAYTLIWTDVVGYLVTLGLGLIGIWMVPGGRIKQLIVAAILFTLSVHIIANGTTRFIVPLLPLFALYAGPLLAGRFPRARWRAIGAAVTLIVFLALVLSRWERDVGSALDFAAGLG